MPVTLIDPSQLKSGSTGGGGGLGLSADDYDWDRTPSSGSIAIGVNTITLPSVPLGVFGTPPNGNVHYVRLSGGSATVTKSVTGASTATPIVITVASTAGLTTGNYVEIVGCLGNLSANGAWYITVLNATTFQLNNSYGNEVGNGAWTSGGTITMGPEPVKITGGTANGDLAIGTLQFTAANAHAAGYTISTATGGVQEAGNAAGSRGTVVVKGLIDFYAPCNFQNSIAIVGGGIAGAIIRKSYGGSNLTVGDFGNLILAGPLLPSAAAAGEDEFSISGIKFIQNSAYAMGGEQRLESSSSFMVTARLRQSVSISHISTDGVRSAVHVDSCLEANVAQVSGVNIGAYGLLISNNYTESKTINVSGIDFQTSLPVPDLVYIAEFGNVSKVTINGMILTGWGLGGSTGRGLVIRNQLAAGDSVSEIFVNNFKITGTTLGVGIFAADAAVGQRYKFSNGSVSGTNALQMYHDGGVSTVLQNVDFYGVNFYADTAANAAVYLYAGIKDVTFDHCKMFAAASSSGPVFTTLGAFTGLVIRNCQIGYAQDGTTSGDVGFLGVYFQGGAVNGTNLVMENNDIYGSSLALAQYCNIVGLMMTGNTIAGNGAFRDAGRTTTGSIMIRNNRGMEDVFKIIASASSVALDPFYPNMGITGTTGVGTVTGLWDGREGVIITGDGAVIFTAGATIGNTFTSTQNKPISYIVTSSKIYLS